MQNAEYIITFFVLAVVAAILGFGGLAADLAGIARFLSGLFIILFLASLVYSLLSGRKVNPPAL